jgi:translation initiation factor IF-3
LKCEIEKKNQSSKRKKKIQKMRVKIDIENNFFDFRVKLKGIINFIKGPIKKIK